MRLFNRVKQAYQARLLEADIKAGLKTWGRQPSGDVKVPVKAEIQAVITRADGTVENLGVISEFEVTREELDELRRNI